MFGKEYHEWREAEKIAGYIEMRLGGLIADVRREYLDDCDDEVRRLVKRKLEERYPLPPPTQFPRDELYNALMAQRAQNHLPTQIVHGHGGLLSDLFTSFGL